MEFIDNPVISSDDTPNQKHIDSCPICGSDFNETKNKTESEILKVIDLFLKFNFVKHPSSGVGYIAYKESPGIDVNTSCLRVDYQKQGRDHNNIQLQLGGSICFVSRDTYKDKITTIANILIYKGKDRPVAYLASQVRGAFYQSFRDNKKVSIRPN